jgi:branched-chain amino acid transport system substrate-binding protein
MQRGLTIAAAAALTLIAGPAPAQDVVKIGMSFAMTGAGFAAAGRQAWAGARLYMQHHGNMVAGKKIEVIMRDDGGVADNARRLVQEMIVNDKVHIIGGGITPTVLAYGQLVTQAKIATVVMISGASVTTTGSPYFVRTSFILAQSSWIMGEWAAKNGSKRVVTLVNEWAPGTEAETAFKQRFTELGGQIVESIRIPLANPDFAPFSSIPIRLSSISRARKRASSPNNSPSGVSPVPGSGSSGQAISPTTTSSTPWAIKCWAS